MRVAFCLIEKRNFVCYNCYTVTIEHEGVSFIIGNTWTKRTKFF